MASIILPDRSFVKYVDYLQKQNAEELAFYPLRALEEALDKRRIITIEENGETAGYLWHGAMWLDRPIVIYQACIDYDLRRQHLGFALVNQLIEVSKAYGAPGIRCRVASSTESNRFWQAIGFYCFDVTPGGVKRKRDINHYRLDFDNLDQGHIIIPSSKATDLRSYNRDKSSGVEMPSRFSRSHYGGSGE